MREIELMIRKSSLKDVELWLLQQYAEIDAELTELKKERELEK
jgi:hypothetical protein